MTGVFTINTTDGERVFIWTSRADVHNDLGMLVCDGILSWKRADFYMNCYLMAIVEVRALNEGLIWYRQPEIKS